MKHSRNLENFIFGYNSPIAIAWGCALFRQLGAVGSTAPSLGGGVPVSRSCLGGVSARLGHVGGVSDLGHVSVVSQSHFGDVSVCSGGVPVIL